MGKKLAVLGSPIAGALSPVVHRTAYAALGLRWTYDALECTAEELPAFLAALDESWAGLSLTMPLKRAAVPLLDEITDTVLATGTANTVVVRDGRLFGENTDVMGLLAAFGEAGCQTPDTSCVIGAGATAATALAALRALGRTSTTIITRDPGKSTVLEQAAQRIGINPNVRPWSEAARHLHVDLLISAVPPDAANSLCRFHWEAGPGTVLDVAYQNWPSDLALTARQAGRTVVNGISMLVHQAALQVELHTGRPAPLHHMRQAAAAQNASDRRGKAT